MSEVKNCCAGCKHFKSDPIEMDELCCGRALKDGIFTYVIDDKYESKKI